MAGETIRLRSESGEAPTFTVGVPFMRDGEVTGAVFIRTRAQRIESGLTETLLWAAALAGGIMVALSVLNFWL